MKLFYHPKDRMRLTVGEDRTYITVKPRWASPQSRPNHYLALLDGKGEEITMLKDPKDLDAESYKVVCKELRARDLTAQVSRIIHAKQEFGATYWEVETDRGTRDFVTQNLQENALWFTDDHLLLLDVDGNRYELPRISGMEPQSQAFIHAIL
jgi:hypothetical protein